MQRRPHPGILFFHTGLGALLLLGAVAPVQGQAKKPDANGAWIWTVPAHDGGPDRKITLKLEVQAGKLTGQLIAPARGDQTIETEIKDGKLKGDEVTFTVSREIRGTTLVTKFIGKIAGYAINGTIETESSGPAQSRKWQAKRERELPK